MRRPTMSSSKTSEHRAANGNGETSLALTRYEAESNAQKRFYKEGSKISPSQARNRKWNQEESSTADPRRVQGIVLIGVLRSYN